jgi:acyl-CoA synthetase (AMP-forming)/AMP-acid ligase II
MSKATEEINTLADLVRAQAARRQDTVALFFEGRETTYGEVDRRSSQIANGLIAEGLKPEARIAFLDKSSDTYFEILFGAVKAGCVMVPVNWRLVPVEIAFIINDSAAEILFVGSQYFDTVEQIREQLKTVKKIISLDDSAGRWESYSDWRDHQPTSDPHLPAEASDVAVQLYTSGTTGHPKGAQLTSRNLISIVSTAVRECGNWDEQDICMLCLPLFHIGGTGTGCIGFYAGTKIVIVREIVPADILRIIAEQHVTKTFVVPALILFLLNTPGINEADLSSLDLVLYGASPAPAALILRAIETFKCDFAQVYGMTETSGAITFLPPEDHRPEKGERMRSCGKPFSMVEIRVVGAAGDDLPPGEVGEIICRTAQNMKGYWNLPEATANTIRGDWLYTGDAGYLDKDGYLYIHDRIKDMIVSGGENIYPAEVESVLFSHPAVADVAVIGVPDDHWGEAVKALVVKKPGAEAGAEEIIAFARERIAHYKAPRSIDFVEVLPRNPAGKILKRELRAPYWAGRERQVN